jgi:hypothetical protein
MRRAVLDSNAVDPIFDLPGAYDAVRSAIEAGFLQLLYTHVNIDEIATTPDLERRRVLLLVLVSIGQLVPTGSMALDVSRWGHARLSSEEETIEALRSGNVDHTRDALIAATAHFEKCALVTNEHRLRGRALERGIEVLTTTELLAEIGYSLPV